MTSAKESSFVSDGWGVMRSPGNYQHRLRQTLRSSPRRTFSRPQSRLLTIAVEALRAAREGARSRRSTILHQRMGSAALVAAVIALGAIPSTALANDCVAQPNLQADQDGRWRYRLEPLSHRKCWYLQRQSPSPESSTAETKPAVPGEPSLPFVLSSLVAAWQSAVSNRPPQDTAIVGQPPAPDTESIVPRRSAFRSHGRHWGWHEKRAARLAQAHQPQGEHTDQHHQLDPAQRDALFEEFLHWSVRQEHAPKPSGSALRE